MKDKTNSPLRELCLQIADSSINISRTVHQFCSFLRWSLHSLVNVLFHPRKIRWNLVTFYMDSCGSDATPIISMLGFLIGVILAFQAIVQLGRFGVQNYVVNLVGTVIVTELTPLVTAVVLAGRTGSSFAAELSSMKNDEEIDALITLGIDPGEYLLLPKFFAMILVLPCLTIISDICGIAGGMAIVCSMLKVSVSEYISKCLEVIHVIDLTQGLIKSCFFGFIVSSVGCMKGFYSERNTHGVGKSTTSAVVSAIFLIVVTDAILTAVFGLISQS